MFNLVAVFTHQLQIAKFVVLTVVIPVVYQQRVFSVVLTTRPALAILDVIQFVQEYLAIRPLSSYIQLILAAATCPKLYASGLCAPAPLGEVTPL